MSRPNCQKCKHFYITWNKTTPNGCRRFGIQCKDNPATIIASAGLGDCQGYEEKKKPEERPKGLDLNRKEYW
ncbi:MAG: uracil-DNA glycosylase [Bacteriovoracaceae bacterium]